MDCIGAGEGEKVSAGLPGARNRGSPLEVPAC